MNQAGFKLKLAAALVSLALAACGGGGGEGDALSGTLGGTAATGAAIAGATIKLKDANGTEHTATTGADGSFSINLDGLHAPLIIEVATADGVLLHSLANVGDLKGPVNVNPVTELVVQRVLGANTAAAYQQAAQKALAQDKLTAADSEVRQALIDGGALPKDFAGDFRHGAMQIGDDLDRTLDTLGLLKEATVGNSGALNLKLINRKPAFINGDVVKHSYDGASDDLLTAGLGKSGLAGAQPLYANAAQPTAAELRRNAIWNQYRALVDISAAGGYGRLWGPNIDRNGVDTQTEGKIAGTEYTAYAGDRSGNENVVLMVQVPASFDPQAPCVVTATSSGSRGIYGAIGTAGEWGLKHGCAVAYSDKGTGAGVYDLTADTVMLQDGTRTTADAAGKLSHFTARLSAKARTDFNDAYPNRLAVKHAHSQQNPERDWGRNTLDAVRFAYYVLNEQFGSDAGNGLHYRDGVKPKSTLVIASSVSNGGGAAIAAAEQDGGGLINGVAVSEPNVQPDKVDGLSIKQGSTVAPLIGKPLMDYISYANLYQPCAAQASSIAGLNAPYNTVNVARAAERCSQLAAKGLVKGTTLVDQAQDALDKLHAYGWTPESDVAQPFQYAFNATQAIAVTYANAYARASVADNLCGFSFAYVDATFKPTAVNQTALVRAYATLNGVPPSDGLSLIYNASLGGAIREDLAFNAAGKQDYNLDGALCLRRLATGIDPVSGARLTGQDNALYEHVRDGVRQTLRSGKLHGKPVLIVTGRSDALLPPNHASRAYVAAHKAVDGASSKLSYIEVTHGQHFDAFLASGDIAGVASGFGTRFVPVHYYFNQALDAMYAYLKNGTALPASQVVRATPRAAQADQLTTANLPPIVSTPAAADAIGFSANTLLIPQ
ncbi:3-hydroxybutyrate oligomer hydrolase family protein [Chitinivorax sp. PXF-14]|uniref:3-hydroxybutyrate oligomer hydrolase family protein n=1 Tax=Chitinivorax sp. PXF-14 TaxID=3230488 RepID=UPI0034663DD6